MASQLLCLVFGYLFIWVYGFQHYPITFGKRRFFPTKPFSQIIRRSSLIYEINDVLPDLSRELDEILEKDADAVSKADTAPDMSDFRDPTIRAATINSIIEAHTTLQKIEYDLILFNRTINAPDSMQRAIDIAIDYTSKTLAVKQEIEQQVKELLVQLKQHQEPSAMNEASYNNSSIST
jgi:hypothetical protein